jgi:hypothetical protein
MHQPGTESKKKCTCPHCGYHRSRDRTPLLKENTDQKIREIRDEEELSGFGKTSKRNKATVTKKG